MNGVMVVFFQFNKRIASRFSRPAPPWRRLPGLILAGVPPPFHGLQFEQRTAPDAGGFPSGLRGDGLILRVQDSDLLRVICRL